MVRIRLLILFFALLSAPALADDAVQVRASAKDDYTRIVFEWPKAPSYVTEKTSSSLTLKFQSAANFKVEGDAPTSMPRVISYKTPDNKTATIGFAQGQDVRHFEIGNKVIVDIRGPAVKEAVTAAEQPKENAKTEAEANVEASAVKQLKQLPAVKVDQETVSPVAKPDELKLASADATQSEKNINTNSVLISVNSVSPLALAVFKRANDLWIVVDSADYPLPPQISGADAKKFGTFEKIPLKEATAFRLALPDAREFHVEGGGLTWKIVSGGTPAAFAPTALKKITADGKASILWPVTNVKRVIDVTDPVAGDVLKVATVDASKFFTGPVSDYTKFGTLQSFAGMAVESRVDDLSVKKTNDGVLIDAPDGLVVSPDSDVAFAKMPPAPVKNASATPQSVTPSTTEPAQEVSPDAPAITQPADMSQLFKFKDWRMGDAKAMDDNRRILMSGMNAKDDQGKAQDLLSLAKMELSYGRGPEAKGYLDLAKQFLPDLGNTPEYKALYGAATALMGAFEEALKNFNDPALKPLQEMAMWRSYSLAGLEDWAQAGSILPDNFARLADYPPEVKTPVALALTEVALRDGDLKKAGDLMKMAESKHMLPPYQAALNYMKGEALRQEGKTDDAEKTWALLRDGNDDLYRAKAGLALTTLQMDKKHIKPAEAIDRLEGLRYAWRGDELETAVNYKLGQLYIAQNDPVKGLTLLKQAAALSPQTDQGKKIKDEMASTFANLFEPNRIKDINPVDAISMYSEFAPSLAPEGAAGDRIVRQLADRLVDADLLPRAASLLQKQVDDGRLSGAEGVTTAIRLSTIYLQDGKMDKALAALAKAEEYLNAGDLRKTEPGLSRDIDMLKAEILSAQGKPEEAFIILSRLDQNMDVLRMRADIAWKAKRWQDAADALEALVDANQISPTRPASEEEAGMLLNWAVALYLADNRNVLANVREKYSTAMSASPRADQFEVVTRPRQSALLADRDTINSIIEETEIFKGFVASSKDTIAKGNATAQKPAQEVAPVTPAKPPVTAQ